MTGAARRNVIDVSLAAVVFLTAFFYRFNTLGGVFGGFTNDEFGYLSRARQIQGGDVPFRDFNDPGCFADRRFADGHAWLLPYYYSGALIVARLRAAKVPVVLTESRSTYDEDYREVFEQIHGYLENEYTDAGEVEFGGSRPLRVHVRADLTPARRYQPFDLPCFMP